MRNGTTMKAVKIMSKKVFEPFSWIVIYHNYNANRIEEINILEWKEDIIKKLKKKCETREEFAEKLRRELSWSFWSKCEWEVLIRLENERIYVRPWVDCRNPEEVEVDVTDRDFDWRGFYDYMNEKRWANKDGSIKIDVYSQIMYQWDSFLQYVIDYKHRYQREDYSVKFAKEKENNK